MTLYEENQDLKLKTVTTIVGDTEYRRNCKFIGGKYYRMERDCFYVKGNWCRVDGGNILYDYELKKWVHKSEAEGLTRGIVDFKDGVAQIGQFTKNPYNNVLCCSKKYGNMYAINHEIIEANGYFEDVSICKWFYKGDILASDIKKRKTIRNEKSFTDRGYNIEENSKDFDTKVENFKNYDVTISKKAKEMAKYLGDTTFGIEIEIAQGNLPEHLQNRHGVVICRDGSIDGGPELVTIPMSGAKGIQTVHDLCSALYTRGETSIACAFHVHFGNLRTDKLFLAAFYTLCRNLQDELFTMFPYYKTDHKGIKKKNYNKKLDRLGIYPLVDGDKDSYETYLVDVYARIFDFLAEGKMTLDQLNKKTRAHPNPRKWERNSR